jgi:hypothetical protein
MGKFGDSMEWYLLNSYRRAINPPTGVTSCGKRREYVLVGSTVASLAPTFLRSNHEKSKPRSAGFTRALK